MSLGLFIVKETLIFPIYFYIKTLISLMGELLLDEIYF